MKILIAIAITAGLSLAQTKPNVADMKGPAATSVPSAVLIGAGGAVQIVTLDMTTLVINGGVLSAKAAAIPTRVVEITQVAAAMATYTLGSTPNAAPELDIYWNGICLSVGMDYTVASNVVTFIGPGGQPAAGDVLRVVYRTQ